jgi:hypothetical protein
MLFWIEVPVSAWQIWTTLQQPTYMQYHRAPTVSSNLVRLSRGYAYVSCSRHPIDRRLSTILSPPPLLRPIFQWPTCPVTAMSSAFNFQSIFSTALKAYERRTKTDILAHPLASQLQACTSPSSILAVLQGQANDLAQAQSSDERLTKWLDPTINVLLAFSATLGSGVSLVRLKMISSWSDALTASTQVFSPATVIFAGAGVLLQVCIFLDISPQPSLTESSTGG